jgi:hypothetical protein
MHATDTAATDRRARSRRLRRGWSSPIVAACDAELGVIAERRTGELARST